MFLDFKFSPCSECCVLSYGWFPGVWILCTDVSEHSLCSIVIGGISRKNAYTTFEDVLDSGPKRRHIKFRRREITQKKEYNNKRFV